MDIRELPIMLFNEFATPVPVPAGVDPKIKLPGVTKAGEYEVLLIDDGDTVKLALWPPLWSSMHDHLPTFAIVAGRIRTGAWDSVRGNEYVERCWFEFNRKVTIGSPIMPIALAMLRRAHELTCWAAIETTTSYDVKTG